MKNRTLFYLTSFVLLGMLALLALNTHSILSGNPKDQTYVKYNDVRGMSVTHNQLPYTLNFSQQNQVIGILNRAVRINEIGEGEQQKPDIEQLTIYLFDNQPNIVLTPITYVDNDLVFSVPQWDPKNYFMELSEGELHRLLSNAYDP